MEGSINMEPYTTDESCLITVIAGQIMEYKYISKDFTGLFIIMSNNFTDSLMREAHERLPLLHSVLENPVTPLKKESLDGMITYFQMLKRMAQEKEHPYPQKSGYLTGLLPLIIFRLHCCIRLFFGKNMALP